ncbi:hypothetical protein [Brachybacterium alimentarium]|uniref:hypothetical protein n=1 Tax=Brachybacterium alimentarium TaxID=47845 RepID=UPI003FD31A79
MNEQPQVVVRFYTLARKIPFLLGKLGDWVLPGGPYTLAQGGAFIGVAFIGQKTMPLWASNMAPIVAWIPVLILAAACALVAGRIPLKGRNPLMILWGVIGYADAPAWGRQAGNTVALKRTRTVKHRSTSPTWRPAPSEPTGETFNEVEAPDHLADVVLEPAFAATRGPGSSVDSRSDGGPSPHQLNEVQQLLAASAQRR